MSEELPKKIGFFDRLKFLFNGNNPIQEALDTSQKENSDLREQLKKEQDEKDKLRLELLETKELYRSSQQKGKEEIEIDDKDKISVYLKEQVILERKKLTKALEEMKKSGIPAKEQLSAIEQYQAKVMGMLYAYTEYDDNVEVREAIQSNIQKEGMKMEKRSQDSFIDGFMHTRYSSCYYDDRDWIRYTRDNKFFSGEELQTPETDKRANLGYYAIREDFTTVKEQLEPHSVDKLREYRANSRRNKGKISPNINSDSKELLGTTKENIGYGLEESLEDR